IEKDPYPFRQAVPSLEERNGDFSDVCPGQDCPNVPGFSSGHVPVAATATAILNSGTIPFPNAYTGCNSSIGYCYLSEASLPTYYREELFRIDHSFSDKTQVGFRYIHDEWDTTVPVPQYGFTQNSFPTIQNRLYGPGLSMVGRLTHTFSATLLNELVFSYVDQLITLADVPSPFVSLQRPGILDAPACAVISNGTAPGGPQGQNNGPGQNCGLGHIFSGNGGKMPGIVIAGTNAEYGGTGFSIDPGYMPWEHTNPTYSLMDNFTKVLHNHNLQFGGQWVIFQRNQTNG
ncbi:carboxypeptidase regulatory-like domain-containing protein, partial [Acidipila sp. 4G-K13]|nr:carboxypeptidase regulatory-like domain-containing protein [Paracidobacterium acidisoli]